MAHVQHHWFRRTLVRLLIIALAFSLIQNSNLLTFAQTGGTLGYGSRVYGAVTTDAPLVTYSLTGRQGDFVSVSADSWTGTLNVQLELIAPNGISLSRSAQNTPRGDVLGAQLPVFLPESGTYILRVSGENGSTGDYLLTVIGRNASVSTPLTFGQPLDVIVAQAAAAQFFSFEAEACPTTLIISDPSEGNFPFVVKLRDQRGGTVALLRGGEQLEDWVTVEALSGRYEVEVSAADLTLNGSIRLLVTCAGENPNCPADQEGAVACAPCPAHEWLVPGGCPNLNLTAAQQPDAPNWVTVTWEPMFDADGYAVYVTGLVEGGGEVYLTHGEWIPGNPLSFTWILPAVGYTGFNFSLQIIVDGVVLCTQHAHVDVPINSLDCPDLGLTAVVTDSETHALTLGWAAGLGADQFDLDLYTTIGGIEGYSGRLVLPGDSTENHFDHFPPEATRVRLVLWMWRDGQLCSAEIEVIFTGGQQFTGEACAVRAGNEGVVARVGPGALRSVFAFLNPSIEYTVIGQAADEDGNLWWQIDKTQFAGHEGVISLWVAQAEVIPIGNCDQVPQAEIPELVPIPEPGVWQPCGSCDTCGHPANECVTSPEGVCLWDPATCQNSQPQPPGDGQQCYAVSASIDPGQCYGGASVMLDTVPNCQGTLYTPGTLIAAHAVAVDPKCRVQSWTGCGVSGSGANITFVPPGSCTIVAHMGY